MKRQVSIKVFLDEELYRYYSGLEAGRKGRVVREALRLYKDLAEPSSSAKALAEIISEIRQGFARIERLLEAGVALQRSHQNEGKGEVRLEDMADMFEGFIKDAER